MARYLARFEAPGPVRIALAGTISRGQFSLMSKIYIPSTGPDAWRNLLGAPQKHWRDGYSAKEVAHRWEQSNGLPAEVAALFEPPTDLILAIPEHKVPMPARGPESQCDVFAILRAGENLVAMAVEAKVAEPFGDTVGKWLSGGGENRERRLAGICELLEIEGAPHHLQYQLFHRTAAAVIEARRLKADMAAMVVQSFSPSDLSHEQYAAFCERLGVSSDRGVLQRKQLADDLTLALAWVTSPVR